MPLKMNDYKRSWDKTTKRWIYEHRLKAKLLLGRELRSNEIVHHKDGDVKNNSIDNLIIMTRSEHCKEHMPCRFRKNVSFA